MDGTALTIVIVVSTAMVAVGLFGFLALRTLCDAIAKCVGFVCDRRWKGKKKFNLSQSQRDHAIVVGAMFVGPNGELYKVEDKKAYEFINGIWVEKDALVVYGTIIVL